MRATVQNAVLLCILWSTRGAYSNIQDTAIGIENRRPGTMEWWRSQDDERNDGRRDILGFATRLSAKPGEQFEFKFESGNSRAAFALRIYRLGYYGGLGGRFVHELSVPAIASGGPTSAVADEGGDCFVLNAAAHLLDCANWQAGSARWRVPDEAVTGIYVAVPFLEGLIRGTYIPLVVLQPLQQGGDHRGSDLLFKTSDLTWVAYNMFGGFNLYTRRNDSQRAFQSRARAVSYNRPFTNRFNQSQGGKHQNFLFGSEYAALRWLEKHGYDVSYAACADIEDFDRRGYFSTNRYKALLSVGHDEYWTAAMRRAFVTARDHGTHLLFWSGNEVFWRVRWQQQQQYAQPRIVIANKETIEGQRLSPSDEDWTGTFIDARLQAVPQPENTLTGQLFAVNGPRHDSIQVHAGENRLRFWRRTTLSASEDIGFRYETAQGMLGYEWDVFSDDCSRPAGLIGLSTTRKFIRHQLMQNYGAAYGGSGEVMHRLTMYRHVGVNGSTALVFGAGTVQWAWGLSLWHDGASIPTDANIQQASINILADMGVQPGRELEELRDRGVSKLTRQYASTDSQPPTSHILHPAAGREIDLRKFGMLRVVGTARDRGGGRVAGVEVSLDGGITWRFANGTYNWVYHHHAKRQFLSFFCRAPDTKTHAWPLANSSHAEGGHHRYHVSIMSRAFDDSGNIEPVDLPAKKTPRLVNPNPNPNPNPNLFHNPNSNPVDLHAARTPRLAVGAEELQGETQGHNPNPNPKLQGETQGHHAQHFLDKKNIVDLILHVSFLT